MFLKSALSTFYLALFERGHFEDNMTANLDLGTKTICSGTDTENLMEIGLGYSSVGTQSGVPLLALHKSEMTYMPIIQTLRKQRQVDLEGAQGHSQSLGDKKRPCLKKFLSSTPWLNG